MGWSDIEWAQQQGGQRLRRYNCDSEYHLARKFPLGHVPKSALGSAPPGQGKDRKPPYSATPMETPVSVKEAGRSESAEELSDPGQFFAATLDVGGLFLVSDSDILVVLETGATVNLVCIRWLGAHNRILQREGYLEVSTCPSSA